MSLRGVSTFMVEHSSKRRRTPIPIGGTPVKSSSPRVVSFPLYILVTCIVASAIAFHSRVAFTLENLENPRIKCLYHSRIEKGKLKFVSLLFTPPL